MFRECASCGTGLEAAYLLAQRSDERSALMRQTIAGACYRCQRLRLAAAEDFMRAADEVRVIARLAGPELAHTPMGPHRYASPYSRMLMAVMSARARCEELKMWPTSWTTHRPPLFYGDERGTE